MSDEMNVADVLMEQVDMSSDPFDDVVEIEPTTEAEGSDPFDSLDEGSDEPKEESSEEEENEAIDSEDSEDSGEEASEDKEEESAEAADNKEVEDETAVDGLDKRIEDGSLELSINDEKVTLKDLKNDYIGQKEISRRFTEYDVKSKQLTADTTEINGYINEFAGKLKSGDSIGAMAYFGEFAGIAPHMIKEQLIAALTPEIIRRDSMSTTEVQNEYLSAQNEYLQGQRESELKQQQNSQATSEAESLVNDLRETNAIDEQTWNDASSHLEKNLQEGEQLTPELVVDTIKYGRMYEQAESVIDLSGETLENKEQWIEELVNVKEKYPDFTEDDLKEVLASALETTKKSASEDKLVKKLESKGAKVSKKQTKQTQPVAEELDPELDDWL
jgi:hypothetical protein